MLCVAALDLHIAVPHSDNNLAPVGLVPHDRKRATTASPSTLRSCGAMIVDSLRRRGLST
eukprot:6821899-Pyramimonas_sp.AAC.1